MTLKEDLENYYTQGLYFQDTPKHTAIQGKTFIKDDTFYIVFNASHGFWDYFINFQCWRSRVNHKYSAHHGYLTRYKKLHPILYTRYRLSGCSRVHIIGYSMGAGVATLATFYFLGYGASATCFEPLAIANKAFANALYPYIDYTVYGNDIVTKLAFFNHHVGKEHHFGNRKRWWKLCIKDHPLENMQDALSCN